jgi:DamX protein
METYNLNYQSALGLERAPFSCEPDLSLYYSFKSFEQSLRLLERLIQGNDRVILVIGERGIGKTTLLNRYLGSTESTWKSCRLRLYFDQPEDRPAPQKRKYHPALLSQDTKEPILMMDDAHYLTQKQLEYLLKKDAHEGGGVKFKRLVLFGDAGIIDAAAGITKLLAEKSALSKIHLSPLSKEETAEYLNHRLSASGYTGKRIFRSSTAKRIYRNSGGIPGGINMAADRILKETYSTEKPEQKRPIKLRWQKVGWVLTGCAVCFIGLAFLFSLVNKPASDIESAKVLSPKIIRKKIIIAKQMKKPEPSAPKITFTEAKETPPQPSLAETEKPEIAVAEKKEPPPAKHQMQQEMQPVESEPHKIVQKKIDHDVGEKQAAESSRPDSPMVKGETALIMKDEMNKKIHRETWILAQDKSYFTIQIMGVRNEEYLHTFIKKHNLCTKGEIAYCRTSYKGKDWYPLLYGIYATKQDAYSAIDELPAGVRRTSPWIRKVSAVQQAIQKRLNQ